MEVRVDINSSNRKVSLRKAVIGVAQIHRPADINLVDIWAMMATEVATNIKVAEVEAVVEAAIIVSLNFVWCTPNGNIDFLFVFYEGNNYGSSDRRGPSGGGGGGGYQSGNSSNFRWASLEI